MGHYQKSIEFLKRPLGNLAFIPIFAVLFAERIAQIDLK
jgi:hypothetical protein